MAKVALVLGAVVAVAAAALPEARELILASAPLLLALVCPIAMVAMMWMMRRTPEERQPDRAGAAATPVAAAPATGVPPACSRTEPRQQG